MDIQTEPRVSKTPTNTNTEVTTATQGLRADDEIPHVMRVKKRDGTLSPVDLNKIVNVVLACSNGLKEVDPMRVATKAISGLYDGA